MLVIPAIDIIGGQCVRLTQGDYTRQTTYFPDPLDAAKQFEDAGFSHLHVVDLDGARAGQIVNHRVLERIATHTRLKVDFGGGLKRDDDLRIAFECGAAQVTGGSIAVREPERFLGWLAAWGPERIILGADARDGYIAVSGWQEATSLPLADFIGRYHEAGIQYVICTDIGRDGTLAGPATDLYRDLLAQFPGLKLIASGGVGNMADLEHLSEANLYGVVAGKAFYEGKLALKETASLFG